MCNPELRSLRICEHPAMVVTNISKRRVRFILENNAPVGEERSDCRIIAQEVIKFHDGYFPETAASVDHLRKKKIQLARPRAERSAGKYFRPLGLIESFRVESTGRCAYDRVTSAARIMDDV